MSSERAAVVSAALDLIKASNPQDGTFVINFSDQAYLDQGYTSRQPSSNHSRIDAR
jgi:hypothetical protein